MSNRYCHPGRAGGSPADASQKSDVVPAEAGTQSAHNLIKQIVSIRTDLMTCEHIDAGLFQSDVGGAGSQPSLGRRVEGWVERSDSHPTALQWRRPFERHKIKTCRSRYPGSH